MTGRERLLATLRRQPVDRVPISGYELTAYGPSQYSQVPSYHALLRALRDQTDALPLWSAGGWMYANVPQTQETWQDGDYTVTRVIMHTPQGDLTCVRKTEPRVMTTWTVEHFCKTEEDIARHLSIPIELSPIDCSGFAPLNTEVGDAGLVLCDMGDAVCHVADLFEFGQFTVYALTEPDLITALCEQAHRFIMHKLQAMLSAGCGPLYRICGAEYCTPPYLPPNAFQQFVTPYTGEMIALIHQYDSYARVHCHGRIAQVLDAIVEMGADALDPIEPPPDGDITLAEVKARYGDRLVLFGNMELKYLEQETPAEIRARVQQMMVEAKQGGGYVLLSTAAPINIPLSPKTEANYFAFIEAGLSFGKY